MDTPTINALVALEHFFAETRRIAIAFSGGCDSAFLLDAAIRADVNVNAYFVQSEFQPDFELHDAKELCQSLDIPLHVISLDILNRLEISSNPPNRCYYCKKAMFSSIQEHARSAGIDVVCDGTNASDDVDLRPGWKALQELGILSPLRMAGLDKKQIRTLSALRGLFTASKPAYACLATRFSFETPIKSEDLSRIACAESRLRDLGYEDFRIRFFHGSARLQLTSKDFIRAMATRREIQSALHDLFDDILIDIDTRPGN